jgi:hypothetical protein
MKIVIRLEELAMVGLSIYTLARYQADWWWYFLLVVGPRPQYDRYLGGNKAGAFVYNFFHHKGLAVLIIVAGLILSIEWLTLIGIVLFGHSSMDRFLDMA